MQLIHVIWGGFVIALGVIGKFFWDKISDLKVQIRDTNTRVEKQMGKLDTKVEFLEEENKNIVKNYKDRLDDIKKVSSEENEKTRVMITDLNVKILERLSSIDVAIANIDKAK